ncbi:hypothetical protein F4859DRAFT_520908 [Xylaria cf. heliscus]|nr:hypothetical protein F4859DRAFT_520908 [Xylaria cf. heliscus]
MNRRFFARRGGKAPWRQHSPVSEGSPRTSEESQVVPALAHRRFTARRGARHKRHQHGRPERSREANGDKKVPQANPIHPPPPQVESESDRNKREADVRVSSKFVRRFAREGHSGRVPPDPSVLPAEFECIHCHRVVKREENSHPWISQQQNPNPPYPKDKEHQTNPHPRRTEHEGVLRKPGYLILKAPRFSAGEYEPCGDDDYYFNNNINNINNDGEDEDAATGGKVWSCCGRAEHEEPRQDWWNVRFSRGDPRCREGVRVPPPHDCEPTYHENEQGAAGWDRWRLNKDGAISRDPWRI